MKKLLLVLFFIFCNHSAKALNIENITITSVSDSEINILLRAAHGSCMFYNGYTYSISDHTIILNVCYNPQLCNAVTYLNNNIQIPLDNATVTNYQLIVSIFFYNLQTFSCDNTVSSDAATLNFSTPLTNPVTLSNYDIESDDDTFLFPNPSKGILNFGKKVSGESVSIYDHSGRKIFQTQNVSDEFIDISGFENGIYFVELTHKNKRAIKKIILRI